MRRALAIAAAIVVGLAVFLVPTLWGKPWSIEHYYLRVLVSFVIEHPMLLSYARILEPYGLDFHSDDLEDFSVAGTERLGDQAREYLAGLREFDREDQTEAQRLSSDVLDWFLQVRVDGIPFLFHAYPVEQFRGLQSTLPDFMMQIHQVDDARDARNHTKRLLGFGVAFDQVIEQLRHREALGVLPPRFVFDAVLEEIEGFTGPAVEENVLYVDFRTDLEANEEVGPDERDALLADAREAIAGTVLPAYARLARVLRDQRTRATRDHGVWKLPDGDAYYRWALRWNTTSDLGPDAIHALGLEEVARIRQAMRETFAERGREVEDPIPALKALGREPAQLYPGDDEGRQQILVDFRALVREAQGRLPDLFGRLPRAPVEVERVPPFKEAGSAGAYYNPPSFDGSRPGTFYVNLRDPGEVQRFGMRTLAYHEAVPGHHLQLALSWEMQGTPFFRRVIPFTAFMEGWALYAERIALEHGWHPTPEDRLGALQAELFRAVRLVVDTGLHWKRWTREQAFDYMVAQTGMPPGDVQAEIDRYIVMPGQACAYKVGQLQILALRDRARERLGPAFDLRAFHDLVLGQGALPLEILDQVVTRWIDAQL